MKTKLIAIIVGILGVFGAVTNCDAKGRILGHGVSDVLPPEPPLPPDSAGIAERRSPTRCVSGRSSIPAASETVARGQFQDAPDAQSNLITGPETLFLDTISNTPSPQAMPSWILWDAGNGTGAGFTQGTVCGAEIAIPAPLLVTKAEFLVLITNAADIGNTEFQVAVFRNTNEFTWSMEQEPLFYTKLTASSPELSMQSLGGNQWVIGVTNMSPFVWGTNRVISLRAVPVDLTQPFCHLQWIIKSAEVLGVNGYTVAQDGTFTEQAGVPAMRLWTKPIYEVRINLQQFDAFSVQLSFVPGVLVGQSSAGPQGPWDWQSTDQSGFSFFETSQSPQGFFRVLPDNQ